MNSTNPALSVKAFSESVTGNDQPMTVQGAVNKCAILLALVCVPGFFVWQKAMATPGSATPWVWGGLITGLVLCLITCFKREWSPVTAPLYAIAEGLALGGISAMYEMQFNGIVTQAVLLTVGTLLAMLALYTMRIIQPTQKFMLGVFAATAGIALTYLIGMVLSLFGVKMGFLYGNGLFGIGFSIVVVIVAALNLILDFATIEQGAQNRAPKYMEWYAAFGLLVTLVWLYLEILRLLSKFASRRN
ncbi:MAG: Bax inhibitor-1/YccA family protein [Verrucomicrobia bacterium]|nr:Bax inhibitor-1/YccA family protein [Verrucomicrobiota bacterium]